MKAVLFDLDGTLLDHKTSAGTAIKRHLELQLPNLDEPSMNGLKDAWQHFEQVHFDRYLRGQCSFQEQRRQRVAEMFTHLGLSPPGIDEADSWFNGYLKQYEASWYTFADVKDALDRLRSHHDKVMLGVLTNGDETQQNTKLTAVGLNHYFVKVLTSSSIGYAKPDKNAFLEACKRLHIKPAKAFYVGDQLEIDAIAAGNAGLRGIWLSREGSSDDRVQTIHNLLELTQLL